MSSGAHLVIITLVILMHHSCAAPIHQDHHGKTAVENNSNHPSMLDDNGLFEGDIVISEELIRKYYNLSDTPENDGNETIISDALEDNKREMRKRAATSLEIRLWPNARVPYMFASGISENQRHTIRDAMDHWEDQTCLRFTPRNHENDYVEFSNNRSGCFSYVGRIKGNQTVNLVTNSRCRFGTVVHEIGHAVGFWHEQSRPDRDDYIQINFTNIRENREHNFRRRSSRSVNSLGSEYDYGSIMHYRSEAFSRCSGCPTIEVSNDAVYLAQGSPVLGQRNGLSELDVDQANLLYSCDLKSGVTGLLVVHIKNEQSLPDTENLYVRITAVDSCGVHHVQTTTTINITSPNWNEYLHFPEMEWQFFRIQTLNADGSEDEIMSVSETVLLTMGQHDNFKHCFDTSCSGSVSYDYSITTATASQFPVNKKCPSDSKSK